jgi:dephospho-CoA kinase
VSTLERVTQIPFIGLTGAVAAGKSEALAALGRLGAATISADAIVHELLDTASVRDLLVGRWGDQVAPEGTIDRARIGAIVFDGLDELAWLEETLHPVVGERIASWRADLPADTPLAVVEVPLLFETGLESLFDATISIVSADAARAQRAQERGTLALEGRSGRQLSQDEKAARATYVISNDGTVEELQSRLSSLLARIAPPPELES